MKNRIARPEAPVQASRRALDKTVLRRRRLRAAVLCASMAAAIWIVAVLAYGDVKRRAAESLADFASDHFTTKPAGEGAGLGLAIAHEIVKSHHGSLHIAPRPEGGTCAAITLPLFSEDDHAHKDPPPHPGG